MPGDRRLDQEAAIRGRLLVTLTTGSRKFDQQRLRLFEVSGIEALGEPAVHGCEQLARLGAPALLAPQPGEARRRPQFEGLCLLMPRDTQRLFESGLGFF